MSFKYEGGEAEAKDANKEEKQDWAEMSNDEEEEQAPKEEEKVEEKPVPKKIIPPGKKGTKNVRGDYVVSTIDIPDMRTGMKQGAENAADDDDSSSDEGYGDEEEPAKEEVKVEEAKVEGKYLCSIGFHFRFRFWSVIYICLLLNLTYNHFYFCSTKKID